MSKDGVTIAIPNCNHELLLPRSMASALGVIQNLKEHDLPGEILVIDDASRDGSLTLLRQLEILYFEAGLRVLALAQNGGLAESRNLALAKASYRYLIFLDAGNELIPENVPLFLRALRETGAVAVYGTLLVRTVSSRSACWGYSRVSFQPGAMLKSNSLGSLALFDRAQLLDAGGYSSGHPMQEDHEQWLHLAWAGRRIVFVPLVFGYHYGVPGSPVLEMPGSAPPQEGNLLNSMYDPFKARKHLPVNTAGLRFHPEIGYL